MAGTVEIPTARGDTIRSDQLGAVLMHEHIFLSDPDMELNYPTAWDEQERIADAVRQFRELKARGIDSLVDLTVVGLGRDVALIGRLAEQVEVNIVVATGLYTYDDLPLQF